MSRKQLKSIETCGRLSQPARASGIRTPARVRRRSGGASGRTSQPPGGGSRRTRRPLRAATPDPPTGDGGRRDQRPGRRRGAAIAADRAAVVGVRQLRDALQGLRPAGRAARPVREDRRRGPGPPLHRRRADGRAPHPVGQGRRLRRPRPPRRRRSASRSARSTRTSSRTTTTCSAASATRMPRVRRKALDHLLDVHRHHGRDRLARPQAVVLRRHELPRPGRHPRPPGPPRRGARGRLRPARRRTSGCCSSTSCSSRRSTRWTCPTGAPRYVHCVALGPEGAGRRRHRPPRAGHEHRVHRRVAAAGRTGSAASTSTRASTPTTT